MITRAEYMEDSENLHQAYYLEYATALGIRFSAAEVEMFAKALETDKHMNNIPLQ